MDKFFHPFSHKEIPSTDTELKPNQVTSLSALQEQIFSTHMSANVA
jgi:hypothetical protein